MLRKSISIIFNISAAKNQNGYHNSLDAAPRLHRQFKSKSEISKMSQSLKHGDLTPQQGGSHSSWGFEPTGFLCKEAICKSVSIFKKRPLILAVWVQEIIVRWLITITNEKIR